jgi:hypothetical protein
VLAFSVWSAVELFSALSVPRLSNASPLAAKRVLFELRGSKVNEDEITRGLYGDLKC